MENLNFLQVLEKLLLKIERSEIASFFYNNFFRFPMVKLQFHTATVKINFSKELAIIWKEIFNGSPLFQGYRLLKLMVQQIPKFPLIWDSIDLE